MAAPGLMRGLAKAHQFLTFTTPPNLQAAVAYGLGKEDSTTEGMRADFARARDRFADGLKGLGFRVLPSAGTYFLNLDIAPLGESDDVAFCERLVRGARRRGDAIPSAPSTPTIRCAPSCGSALPAKRDTTPSTGRWSACAGSRPGAPPDAGPPC